LYTTLPRLDLHPDEPDHRDWPYQPAPDLGALPTSVDLRRADCGFPPIFDQGHLNSCTANAVAAALAFDIRRQRKDDTFIPSRLFIYYNERYSENAIGLPAWGNHGAPAYMRDCIKVVDDKGFCSEDEWPYDETAFDTRPPDSAYRSALEHRSCEYYRINQDLTLMKSCLAEGYPFVCGIRVYRGFLSPQVRAGGAVPLPAPGEPMIGGHALAVVGYDDAQQRFIVRNSLGTGWGDQGHGSLPYAYVCDVRYAMDFWVLRKVTEDDTATDGGSTPAAPGPGAAAGTGAS
jgi:C1A family cysteine protease